MAADTGNQPKPSRWTSAHKVIAVLLAFTPERPALTAREVASITDLPESSVYRYLSVLRGFGLIESGGDGQFILGVKAISLGRVARSQYGITDIARPIIDDLAEQTGESVILVRRSQIHSVCIDRRQSRHPVALSFDIGQVTPLSTGAVSKLLLAHAPTEVQEQCIRDDPAADRRQVDLATDLKQIRQRGYAESLGEVDPGIWGVAAPVYSWGGEVLGLSTAGPNYRLDEADREHFRSVTVKAAELLSAAIAGVESPVR